MLDDLDADGGKLEDLAALAILRMKRPGTFAEERPAVGAARIITETVFDRAVRVLGLKQGLTDMTGLRPDLSRRLLGFGGGEKLPRSDEGGRLLLRLLRSSSRTLASSASTRSQSFKTKSAMASGSLLARAMSCSRVGRSDGTEINQNYNLHSTSSFSRQSPIFRAE
jgi:hypothetical protein